MKAMLEKAAAVLNQNEKTMRETLAKCNWENNGSVYAESVHKLGEGMVMLARDDEKRFLVAVAPRRKALADGIEGEIVDLAEAVAVIAPLSAKNAAAIRQLFPWCAPQSLRSRRTTVGCGDRLGMATRGHIAAAKKFQLSPVLAQQSMRELSMTNRTFQQVVDDATFMVFECDYQEGWGADGDHLKKLEDIDKALAAGMPMITLDLSDVMNAAAADWTEADINTAFDKLSDAAQKRINEEYADKSFVLEEGKDAIKLDALTARRCAVMYDAALDFAKVVFDYLTKHRGPNNFDLEISIDETTGITLPTHHLYIARELCRMGVEFSSLAPRFVGEFQKAVDYIGDLKEFDADLTVHAVIARAFGNYKLSIHSGSDKFMVYPSIGRESRGYLHLKTAGTSWLVAMGVIAENDPELFRKLYRESLKNFDDMLKLYHITADLTRIPELDSLSDAELPKLLEMPDARQLIHITYGPLLTGVYGREFFASLHRLEKEYLKATEAHFYKHFSLLGVPAK